MKKIIYFGLLILLIPNSILLAQRQNGKSQSYKVKYPSENEYSIFKVPDFFKGIRIHINDRFGPVMHGTVYYRINDSKIDSISIIGYQSIQKSLKQKEDTLYLEFVSSGHKTYKCKVSYTTPFAIATTLETEPDYEGEPRDPNEVTL